MGASGFGFIDKLSYATTPDQLAWAVAHNVSHELMHALGVATHPDQTGQYLEFGRGGRGQMLTEPNARLSPQAVQLLMASSGTSAAEPRSWARSSLQATPGRRAKVSSPGDWCSDGDQLLGTPRA